LPRSDDPRLLVGYDAADDGAVFRLDGDRCLIQTVDFFTPIVDDPYQFGAIAAANALSDVYAMGGTPLTALSLVCFSYKTWPGDVLERIMAGGADTVRRAGALVVGGHSVQDQEIKFGYAVTGLVDVAHIWRNDTPRAGDALVLTKPLGTGTLTTAVKKDLLGAEYLDEPVREMGRLNAVAAELARGQEVHAVTDITGFGLIGHLYEMLRGSRLGAEIDCEALPLLGGVWEAIAAEAFTGAHTTNRHYVADYQVEDTPAHRRYGQVLYDPQTSGGLLIALPETDADVLVTALTATDHRAARIGRVTAAPVIRCR